MVSHFQIIHFSKAQGLDALSLLFNQLHTITLYDHAIRTTDTPGFKPFTKLTSTSKAIIIAKLSVMKLFFNPYEKM